MRSTKVARARWRVFLVVVAALFFARAARAAPATVCPQSTISWAVNYTSQPIQSVSYDSTTQYMYVVFTTQVVWAFYGVPTSLMQTFSQTKNPMQIYQNSLLGRYHVMLLFETNNCPIMNENGLSPIFTQ